jgi:hypothetical protein
VRRRARLDLLVVVEDVFRVVLRFQVDEPLISLVSTTAHGQPVKIALLRLFAIEVGSP